MLRRIIQRRITEFRVLNFSFSPRIIYAKFPSWHKFPVQSSLNPINFSIFRIGWTCNIPCIWTAISWMIAHNPRGTNRSHIFFTFCFRPIIAGSRCCVGITTELCISSYDFIFDLTIKSRDVVVEVLIVSKICADLKVITCFWF
ncbi:hypothetical protein D3C71_1473720 [compost metagenome]